MRLTKEQIRTVLDVVRQEAYINREAEPMSERQPTPRSISQTEALLFGNLYVTI
jgi:hypothetical protein